jgi:hypothetical protein
MQGRLSGLEVKERRVECAEAVWWRHACKKSAAKRIAKGSRLSAEEPKEDALGRPLGYCFKLGGYHFQLTPYPFQMPRACGRFGRISQFMHYLGVPAPGWCAARTKAYLCLGTPSPEVGIGPELDDCTIQSRGGD